MGCRILRRIDISPAFVAFVCAYYYFDPVGTFVPFFLAVALHELGHIIALSSLRIKIHSLRLRMCGAQIETAPLSYLQELIVASAGPTVNFLLLCLYREKDPLAALINFCLLIYNLLPLYPLDGGRIINSLLQLLLPQRIAETIVHLIGAITLCSIICFSCYLTCVWHAGLWPVFVSGILFLRLSEIFLKEKRKFAHL